jgi:two-component system, chemotaxis family, CheB/CheR fusion protein
VNYSSDLIAQARSSFQASREAVRRAHERAQEMQGRSQRLRQAWRDARKGHHLTDHDLSRLEEQTKSTAREQQRFIAVVSHELRQPVNAALAAVSLLDAAPSPVASERARLVLRRQLLHMSTLLDDLLDTSRLALRTIRLERVPIDLGSVLQEAVDTVAETARAAGLTIDLKTASSRVPLLGDSSRLQQALTNLLTNAVRYTPSGGRVNVSMVVDGETAVIHVDDTGQGIESADLANIFEPFWRGTSSEEGFGIGLALVRGIVELHDGSVAAFSDGLGTGTRFTVTLPISGR